jgi:two-component system, LytTR family, sensor kinase
VDEGARSSQRVRRWMLVFAFWTLVVLVYSTRSEVRGEPLTWLASLRLSMAQWYAWALLTPLVVLGDRWLPVQRDELVQRLLLHAPLAVVFTVFHGYLEFMSARLLGVALVPWPGPLVAVAARVVESSGGLVYLAIVGMHVAFEYQNHLNDRQVQTAELERLLAESRFETLRTQFQPYLLSKALNAIASHVEGDPRTARRMLEQLGSLIRQAQEHAREQEVPLERELAFVESYLTVQKARFDDRLVVTTAIDPDVRDAIVPTFILHPLVDNAIHHTMANRPAAARIDIAARRVGDWLHLSVRDDGPGLPAGWDPERGFGTGLSNARERLRRLYGDRHTLTVRNHEGAGVHVEVALPLLAATSGRRPDEQGQPAVV